MPRRDTSSLVWAGELVVAGGALLIVAGVAFGWGSMPPARTDPPWWSLLVLVIVVVGAALLLYGFLLAVAWAGRRSPIRLEHSAGSVALRLNLPTIRVKRRLKRETLSLVGDIRSDLRQQSSPLSKTVRDHTSAGRAMEGASKEERQAIWDDYTARMTEGYEQERQELAEKFGGRLQFVLDEYERLGRLEQSQKSNIQWLCSSRHWLSEGASQLEALALKL